MAVIDLWDPESHPEDYEKHEQQGITIFAPKKMAEEDTNAVITLATMFRWQKLILELY